MARFMVVLVDKKTLKRIESYPLPDFTSYADCESNCDAFNGTHPANAKTEFAIDDYEPSAKPHLVRFNTRHGYSNK